MKYFAIALLFVGVLLGQAIAQSWNTTPPAVGIVVTTCGSGTTYTAGQYGAITINTAGSLCVNQ